MAINRNITGIKIDDSTDNGKVPTYNSTTKVFDMSSAGIGNVTKVGTPVNNQIGVWTGDGTIEGDTLFNLVSAINDRDLFVGTQDFSLATAQLSAYSSGGAGNDYSSLYLQNNSGTASATFNAREGFTYLYLSDTSIGQSISIGAVSGGSIAVKESTGKAYGILNFNSVTTSDKTFTFPNTTGTIALTSDISALSSVYQPLDSDLTTIAGLTATTDNFIVSVASAWASRTPSQVRTTLGLVIGTNVQAFDTDLTTWAGITPGTGVGTALALNVGSAGAFVTFNGALGTPSSGTVTNLTGTASININGTVGATTPAAGTFTAAIANSFVPNSSTIPTNGLYLPAGNTLGWAINSAAEMQLTATALSPSANDGNALGTTALMWADLFLASGGVVNFNNGAITLTHDGTNTLTLGGNGANGNKLVLPAGGTSLGSLNITPGTLTTTPVDGDIEMDGNAFYVTTDGGNRGVIGVLNYIRQHANRANFANNANQQAIFDSVTNGTITLETGTYLFEGVIQIQGMSATGGNLKFSLAGAGGGTFANILYVAMGSDSVNDALVVWSGISEVISTQTVTNIATATTATVCTIYVRGSFECTVAGTLIPSVAQTTAINNSANTLAGSWFYVNRIGSTTGISSGQWS